MRSGECCITLKTGGWRGLTIGLGDHVAEYAVITPTTAKANTLLSIKIIIPQYYYVNKIIWNEIFVYRLARHIESIIAIRANINRRILKMKTSTKILGMTAAVAILSAPALAESTVRTQVGETVTYKVTSNPAPGSDVVGYTIEADQQFARLDANKNGTVSMREFQNGSMLDNEAEIFSLFDSDQSGYITPEEFEKNSRYGNARLTNKTANRTKQNSNNNWGSLREKYYTPEEYTVSSTTYVDQRDATTTNVEAGIDYDGVDTEPNVNQGIDYRGDVRTPGTVNANITYEGGTNTNYNYN